MRRQAAIASELAAEYYEMDILDKGIEDSDDNKTRFLLLVCAEQTLNTPPHSKRTTALDSRCPGVGAGPWIPHAATPFADLVQRTASKGPRPSKGANFAPQLTSDRRSCRRFWRRATKASGRKKNTTKRVV